MNKLWVYGCSFSEPFQLEKSGSVWDNDNNRIISTDYWGTHLAEYLGLDCITRSKSGIGLNYIARQIEMDFTKWSKDDIIIISPSFLDRVNIMEFTNGDTRQETVYLYKEWNQIFNYNQQRWGDIVTNCQHAGYRVYTWTVDNITVNLKNVIPAPDGNINWKTWMDKHYEYWTSLPGVVYPAGDWHFNPWGHCAVAEQMYKVITK